MKISRIFAFISLLIFFSSHLKAQQNAHTDSLAIKLDDYLTSAVKAGQFNGTVLVAEKGKIILQKGYGWKNFSAHTLNDNNTLYQIGSITKPFTAIIILKLQEEGKLSVNDLLSKYFPDQKGAEQITIQNLLDHTSGIYNYTDDIGPEDSAIVSHPVDRQLALNIFINKDLLFKPGTKFSYSNSGYFLLGMIIEKITGKLYQQVLRQLIFAPLGMQHTGFDFINLKDTAKATGYDAFDSSHHNIAVKWDSTVTYSAGSIYSTTGDLYKWSKAIAKGELLSVASWKQAFTPNLGNYGYGWWIDTLYGNKYITHSGGLPGFMSNFVYYPDKDITIILLNNFGNFGQSLTSVNMGLSAIMFNKPYLNYSAGKEAATDKISLQAYAGTYVYNDQHTLLITFENDKLFVEDTNPQDKLPKVQLHYGNDDTFYITEANLRFQFLKDKSNHYYKLITYNSGGKDAEWLKK